MTELGKEKYIAILHAAQSVFLRHGYRKTTMGDLAKEAQMSRPALYLYFKNKDEICRAVAKAMGDSYFQKLDQALPNFEGSLAERLKFIMEVVFTEPYVLFHTSPHANELMSTGYDICDDEVEEVHRRLHIYLVPHLEECCKEDAAFLAHVVVNAARGIKKHCTSEEDLRSSLNKLVDLAVSGSQK